MKAALPLQQGTLTAARVLELGESHLHALCRDTVPLALVALEYLLERAGRLVGLPALSPRRASTFALTAQTSTVRD